MSPYKLEMMREALKAEEKRKITLAVVKADLKDEAIAAPGLMYNKV